MLLLLPRLGSVGLVAVVMGVVVGMAVVASGVGGDDCGDCGCNGNDGDVFVAPPLPVFPTNCNGGTNSTTRNQRKRALGIMTIRTKDQPPRAR